MQEVLFTAQIMAARNYQYFTLYTVVGIFYFAVGLPGRASRRLAGAAHAPGLPPEAPRMTAAPMVEAIEIRKSFGALEVIKGVEPERSRSGEVVCIIGPSGSGKSTFLRCLNWLEVPERGEIRIEGRARLPRDRRTAQPAAAGAARDRRASAPGSAWCSRPSTCSRT